MDNREIDALIHEKVFRLCAHLWLQHLSPMQCFKCGQSETQYTKTPYYSTDITAAWQVVEQMDSCVISQDGARHVGNPDPKKGWRVNHTRNERTYSAFGETAPMAVCLAALQAIGEDIK
ncbi:MAG: hypothetical protein EXR50_05120 [Dehalococcoidia bacterium]|nr:hypothetical protein [Dehalococcoidia bacterium]